MCAALTPERASLGSRTAAGLPARPFRSIELFSGAGGLALGTHAARFQHEILIEWNSEAAHTLRRNVLAGRIGGISDWRVEQGDIRDYDFSDHGQVDLLAGGPPCQPFSIGGRHKGDADRRNMIPEFARVLGQLAPRAFVMENVRGMLRPAFRPYFDYVRRMLARPAVSPRPNETWEEHDRRLLAHHVERGDDLSYDLAFQVLNAADFGVPQIRHRVFVVGIRSDLKRRFTFPTPTHSAAALRSQQIDGTYWARHAMPPPDWSTSPPSTPALALHAPWRTVRDAIHDLPTPTLLDDPGLGQHSFQPGARAYPGHTGSPLDWPAKTLKAGDHGVPGGENMLRHADGSVRYFSVREAARLQTFPDGWMIEGPWSEAMRQIGNAVPVSLAQAVATSVADVLSHD